MLGLDRMKKKMTYDGITSDDRNVRGKYLSFKSALENSYQAEWIIFNDRRYRCLINPDKLTNEYDQKEISIDFCAGMKNGDVFYWERNDSYWIVYLQRVEEEAYFRAQIRQCDYEINNWHVYVRGPVETALVWRQKHQIEVNDMNLSILVYVTKTEETLEYFSRLNVIKFDGHNWRVAATDKYSQDGIIEVYLEEYFDNTMEDSMIVPEETEPDISQPYIDGPQFVRAYDKDLSFSIVNSTDGVFVVNSSKVKITSLTTSSCTINVLTGKSGSFILSYEVDDTVVASLDVTIQSL